MCSNSRKYRVLDVQMPAQYYDVYITVRISLSGSSGGACELRRNSARG